VDLCSESSIREVLLTLTEEDVLDDDTSAQNKAANWLINVDAEEVCADSARQLKQRYALAALYYGTDGDKWNFCSAGDASPCDGGDKVPFLSAGSECNWYGIECDFNGIGMVVEFKLKPCKYSILPHCLPTI
jgi:hypothetical protein